MNLNVKNDIAGKEILYVIKIGGNVIDDDEALQSFLQKFSIIKARKILVHGGGKIATKIGDKLDIVSEYINGRRITNNETIDLVTMVYAGLINKKITASLQALKCSAIGLCGADANLIPATKRPAEPIDFGWVGDVIADDLKVDSWKIFLENNLVPIIAPLTHDGQSHLLNTNADTMAGVIAMALQQNYNVRLIYCFEKQGILENIENENSIIAEMNSATYSQLKSEQKLFAGILPKLENALSAARAGVTDVRIGHSNDLEILIYAERGTKILA